MNSLLLRIIRQIKIIFVYPIVAIFHLPVFIFKEFIGNFVMAKDTKDDPVISYSFYHKHGGQIYWYWHAYEVGKYGILNYDFLSYDGVPTGFAAFPLSTKMIYIFGYKKLVLFGMLLLSVSIFLQYHYFSSLSVIAALIIAIACIFSNITIEHIIVGTYELLGWAFLHAAIFLFFIHFSILSGIFLGLTILIHPGIACLGIIYLILLSILRFEITQLFIVGLASFIIALFWLIPYIANRDYLARHAHLSKIHDKKLYNRDLILLGVYLLFSTSVIISNPNYANLTVFIPGVVYLYNIKVRWVFSSYTVRFYMFFVGLFELSFNFSYLSLAFLILLFGYLHPAYFSYGKLGKDFLFKIKSFKLGKAKNKILELFQDLKFTDKLAFETSFYQNVYFNSFLSFVLLNLPVPVLNGGIAEIYNSRLRKGITDNLSIDNYSVETYEKLKKYGFNYMISYSKPFKDLLIRSGYSLKKTIDINEYIDVNCNVDWFLPKKIYILKMALQDNDLNVKLVSNNGMNVMLEVLKEQKTHVNYQYFPGVIAELNKKIIPIIVDENGYITIELKETGKLKIYFSKKELYKVSLKKLLGWNLPIFS